jgi:oxygen-independent coproporphyrinogen-3 oxidase
MPQNRLGLYIHVPFCAGEKCPYCDFYSLPYEHNMVLAYISAVKKSLEVWGKRVEGRKVDTIYFGGGTPSLLKEGLADLLLNIKSRFKVTNDAEITLEANPSAVLQSVLPALRGAGFNRISIGMQSASPAELKLLGRKHTQQDTSAAVTAARSSGFENISLDLMLATPGQSRESLLQSINFAAELKIEHISAYLLKIEPETTFYKISESLLLPNDDEQAEFYLLACDALENLGYAQYEISNFAKKGFDSRHNTRYWNCDEYIGIGPSAHSFFEGRRFFYKRELDSFISEGTVTDDGEGGGIDEYIMLRLRLTQGLNFGELYRRYGVSYEKFNAEKVERLLKARYLERDKERLWLTKKGFVVSNAVISQLLF